MVFQGNRSPTRRGVPSDIRQMGGQQMISTGYPGDSDPLAELPACPECGIWLTQDLSDDWICEDCDAKENKNEEKP
jgi:hypothetical protein